jgi:phenylacetic acid degradation operon negative regulatory protein
VCPQPVRSRRPLTARSVLASALLGSEPPELPVARLVAIGGLFGMSDNRVRVALSRMAAAGEVVAVDGRYRLAGALLDRQARQRASRAARVEPWDGRWVMAVIPPGRRSADDRAATRSALTAARLAERREGVWLRPANVAVDLPPGVEGYDVAPGGPAAPLAAALWDLRGWAAEADALRQELRDTAPALTATDQSVLAPGFVLSAAVLRHFQADPLLPAALVPPDWPGQALRREYDDWDDAYRRLLRHYQRA